MTDQDDGEEGSEYHLGAYRKAHEDAQRTLDEHLKVFNEIAQKGGRISRFSGAVIAIFVAVGTSQNISQFLNIFVIIGLGFLIGSAVLGLYGQKSQQTNLGVGEKAFIAVENKPMKEIDYLRWIVAYQYPEWINEASKKAKRKNHIVECANYLSISGILLILAGIFFTTYY